MQCSTDDTELKIVAFPFAALAAMLSIVYRAFVKRALTVKASKLGQNLWKKKNKALNSVLR